MTANVITSARIVLTFTLIILIGKYLYVDIAAIATVPLIFILDAVDGYVARKYKQANAVGAVLDIAADRIIENVFWIYFTANQIIHFWMPVAILTRGFVTDAIRSFALRDGNTPFEMNTRYWTHAMTSSRISRALSGTSKMIAFFAMAALLAIKRHQIHIQHIEKFQKTTVILASIAVAICILRGIPVIVEGQKYIKKAFKQ